MASDAQQSLGHVDVITHETMQLAWNRAQRVACLTFSADTHLTGAHGNIIADCLTHWVRDSEVPFALLADAGRVKSTDAEYRAATAAFFRQHKRRAFIALLNLNPVIAVVAEMFRIGVGLQLKPFPSEDKARAWLRENGVPA